MKYHYTGTEHLVYPYAAIDGHRGPLVVEPGMDPVDLDEPPDTCRWEPLGPQLEKEEKPRTPRSRTTAAKAAPRSGDR